MGCFPTYAKLQPKRATGSEKGPRIPAGRLDLGPLVVPTNLANPPTGWSTTVSFRVSPRAHTASRPRPRRRHPSGDRFGAAKSPALPPGPMTLAPNAASRANAFRRSARRGLASRWRQPVLPHLNQLSDDLAGRAVPDHVLQERRLVQHSIPLSAALRRSVVEELPGTVGLFNL